MARQPKPWFWKERGAWYATVAGRRHRLHEDKKKADREFYRIMAEKGRLGEEQKDKILVADAVEAMLASIQHNRPSTRRLYEYNLGPFAAKFARRRLDAIAPEDVVRFVSGYEGRPKHNRPFGDASRHLMFRFIKTLFKWAKETGILGFNPMHGRENPWKLMARTRTMTEGEYASATADRRVSPQFREILEFLWRTGARPGEVAAIQARHLDARLPIVRLQPTEHKTGTKTGLQREIVMPADLMERLRGYAVLRPKGALLLNRRGKPWSQNQISQGWARVKRWLGFPADLVVYLARHSFGTRCLDGGVSIALAAKLMGHTDTATIMKHYYHPDTTAMIDAVDGLSPRNPSGT